jgi:hypothetical protein
MSRNHHFFDPGGGTGVNFPQDRKLSEVQRKVGVRRDGTRQPSHCLSQAIW